MPASPDTLLESFHRTLVDEIRQRRPEYLREEFTVAEIYQELVPYRSHRDRIGVEMNGDYEAALLRLLAGEGGYLVLGSEAAREEIGAELESANPDTSLFRQFAALDVRLNPELLDTDEPEEAGSDDAGEDDAAAGVPSRVSVRGPVPPDPTPLPDPEPDSPPEPDPTPLPDPDTPLPGPDRTPSPGPDRTPGTPPSPEPTPPPRPRPPSSGEADEAGASGPDAEVAASSRAESGTAVCRWCRGELPGRRRNLHFCPHCGTGIHLRPCPECGEELEQGWRFCIACGTEIAS